MKNRLVGFSGGVVFFVFLFGLIQLVWVMVGAKFI